MNDDNPTISFSEVMEDFTKAARIADENGKVTILKDGKPAYILMKMKHEHPSKPRAYTREELFEISERIIQENLEAYKELAKR